METTTLALRVRFPNGVYRGHLPDKSPEIMPQPARLHAALLNSAGRGTLAERTNGGTLRPSQESIGALEWLENHPPAGIEIPPHQWANPQHARFIYREVSSINDKRRTEERAISDGVAVGAHFGYLWEEVPVNVAQTIEGLCSDIAYIGEAESTAIVEQGEVNPTLKLDSDSSPFKGGGIAVDCANPGRTGFLVEQFEKRTRAKVLKNEKIKWSEQPLSTPTPRAFVSPRRYARIEPRRVNAPWTDVVFLGLPGEDIPLSQRVELAKTTHRAIIAAIGFGASPMITGKYPKSIGRRPANHLAIHYLPELEARRFGYTHGVIALLIPQGAEEVDLRQLAVALKHLASNGLWSAAMGRRKVVFRGDSCAAENFWPEVEKGQKRLWFTATPVVPDTRPVSRRKFGADWTLGDAGLLSMAFTWKDELEFSGKHDELYINARNAAYSRGARVFRTKTVSSRPRQFAHTMPTDVSVQAWQGSLDLGDLGDDRTICAIGQSRHMGGGLLVPLDIPLEQYQALRKEKKR
ncbi:type I-G CRISPR-associated protein Csb2 [Corynebacterium resistens]|uniref:type I-G CRISPR-associated protein Csb2 n=1 Tax=Corynebacterium resistens TaxID=258224 RepID=UPI00235215FD|nr:type I-U CRISPR-associated protein Csb2 [Corynebacterium resistens]